MDKKNTLLGLVFLILGFSFFVWQSREAERYQRERRAYEQRQAAERASAGGTEQVEPVATAGLGEAAAADRHPADPDEREAVLAGAPAPDFVPEIFTLENGTIRATFSTAGGNLDRVEFLRTGPKGQPDPFVYNAGADFPALGLAWRADSGQLRTVLTPFEVVRRNDQAVTFRATLKDGLVLTRTFSLAPPDNGQDPYTLRHEMLVENPADRPVSLPPVYLTLGTMEPLSSDDATAGEFLNLSTYDGKKVHYVRAREFLGSAGFLGLGAKAALPRYFQEVPGLTWVALKNQFFVSVLRELAPGDNPPSRIMAVQAEPVFTGSSAQRRIRDTFLAGAVGFQLGEIPAKGSTLLGTEWFIGPKEFIRLQSLGAKQEALMQYWGPDLVSQAMNLLLYGIHQIVGSWGWSVILMTVVVKLVLWPLTTRGMRAQKINAVKMTPLQDEMKLLREKYKDNPHALQTAMADLYRKHDINPAAMMGGCIPMLIQIPIFIGLYGMLRVAPELRFAPFLWIQDLSQPDTVAVIAGIPLNLMPLIYGAAMFWQMHMTPMPETADETQRLTFQMMKFMPIMFIFMFYNFASAMPLYFTTQACLTMLQQFLINRQLQPEIDALKEAQKSGKKIGPDKPRGPTLTERLAKRLEEQKSAAEDRAKTVQDGLGSTRKLKGGSGLPHTPPKRRKKR